MPERGLFLGSTKDAEGPVGPGTPYTDRTRLGTVRGEVSAFDRPHRVLFHCIARLFGMTGLEGWPGYTPRARW